MLVLHRLTVEIEFDDVLMAYRFRGERAIRKRLGWSGWRALTCP